MTDLLITMSSSGTFTLNSDVGRIEEYCAKRLKIKLNTDFLASAITYYTLSFEPYSLSRKIITENIYRDSDTTEGMYFADGCIFCPVYDYIAVSPKVMVQIDAYETDESGNVTTIIKSGIFTLEFAPSLTGEGMMLETTRPDVKFFENVQSAVTEALKTEVIDGANLKNNSVTGDKIASETIKTVNLADASVTTEKIANRAVTDAKLADKSVTSQKLADSSVTEIKISDNAVTTDKISDKNVTSAKLADNSVTNAKISSKAVNTQKIADGAVTPAKLDRTYLTEHQNLNGFATEEWVKAQNYVTGNSLDERLPEKLSGFENDIAVSFVSQTLTQEQKDTALKNIGAVKAEDGKTLSQNDFTDADKEKLDSALTSHQDISMKADIKDLSAVAFSGSYNDLENLPDFEELKANAAAAFTHSQSEHAPSDAEENIIENIAVNGEDTEIKDKRVSLTVLSFTVREPIFVEV